MGRERPVVGPGGPRAPEDQGMGWLEVSPNHPGLGFSSVSPHVGYQTAHDGPDQLGTFGTGPVGKWVGLRD